jgi:hypothetical protein
MKKICINCRYWAIDYYDDCDRIRCDTDDIARIEAESDDDQGLVAGLRTSPNFGCTLFDKKEFSDIPFEEKE